MLGGVAGHLRGRRGTPPVVAFPRYLKVTPRLECAPYSYESPRAPCGAALLIPRQASPDLTIPAAAVGLRPRGQGQGQYRQERMKTGRLFELIIPDSPYRSAARLQGRTAGHCPSAAKHLAFYRALCDLRSLCLGRGIQSSGSDGSQEANKRQKGTKAKTRPRRRRRRRRGRAGKHLS